MSPKSWFSSFVRSAPLHPLLFGLYPVLALLAANIGQAQPAEGLRILLASGLLSAGILFGMWLTTRHVPSAAKAYSDQATYLNGRLLRGVDAILSASDTAPIIVIMGDHGWADRNPEDKLSILNAYHLPGENPPELWPTITPVNTFRLVFDAYFGGEFGPLEDRSYFSHEDDVFNFTEVVNTWSGVR